MAETLKKGICFKAQEPYVPGEDDSCIGMVFRDGKKFPCSKTDCFAYLKNQKPLENAWKETQLSVNN